MGIVRNLALGASMALGLAAGQAQAAEHTFRMTSFFSETSSYNQLFAYPFADMVEKLTGGRVEIEVFPAGVIAPGVETYQAVMDGRADLGYGWPAYLVNDDPTNGILSGPVGGFGVLPHQIWLREGGGHDLWVEYRRASMGLHPLLIAATPSEIYHSKRALASLDDFGGLKIRTAGTFAKIAPQFGAAPVTVPGSEVYAMLERGVVDAIEWGTPHENQRMGFQEIAEYISYPGPHSPQVTFEMVMKPEVWEGLPEDLQELMQIASDVVTWRGLLTWMHRDLVAMDELRAGENTLQELEPAAVEAISTAGRAWAVEQATGNEWMARAVESYYGFADQWERNKAVFKN